MLKSKSFYPSGNILQQLKENSLVVTVDEKAEQNNLKNKLALMRKIVQEKENELKKTTTEC